ncbi:MAG: AraC family transcriptional regulator [Chitinophagaceae bacterium BSSC1]|nr:MAG: AraC family transcriptional regulator [Chitinophagaceae bacterium BSSC1]
MQPVFIQPKPALKELVNHYMVFHTNFPKDQPAPCILLPPLPEQCLLFYPLDPVDANYLLANKQMRLYTCCLVGPQTNTIKLQLGHQHVVIKVSFQPGGLYRLLGIPMQELLQVEAFNASDFLGNLIIELQNQIWESENFLQMVNQIEEALLKFSKRLKEKLPIDQVLQNMLHAGGLMSMDKAASDACLSIRQFERQFKQRIGLSPKFYSRLIRFSNAWILKENQPNITWTAIAHQTGYFDQMHLIRDFKEFAAVNPKQIEQALLEMPFNPRNRYQ